MLAAPCAAGAVACLACPARRFCSLKIILLCGSRPALAPAWRRRLACLLLRRRCGFVFLCLALKKFPPSLPRRCPALRVALRRPPRVLPSLPSRSDFVCLRLSEPEGLIALFFCAPPSYPRKLFALGRFCRARLGARLWCFAGCALRFFVSAFRLSRWVRRAARSVSLSSSRVCGAAPLLVLLFRPLPVSARLSCSGSPALSALRCWLRPALPAPSRAWLVLPGASAL